jgi:hypothetical protein
MSANPNLTAAARRQAIEVARESGSVAQAAAAVGASWNTVSRWLAQEGVDLGPVVVRNATMELWQALELVQQGEPVLVAARTFGVNANRLARLADALGIERTRRPRGRRGLLVQRRTESSRNAA